MNTTLNAPSLARIDRDVALAEIESELFESFPTTSVYDILKAVEDAAAASVTGDPEHIRATAATLLGWLAREVS